MFTAPPKHRLRWARQFRIIPTRYPPVDLFESLGLSEERKRAYWTLQARINPRLLQESGDLRRVRAGDMVSGPGASIVMAAFTHIGFPSRFADGSFGVYYASRTLRTAIRETVFHREADAVDARLAPQEFDMRAYVGRILKPFYDVRGDGYEELHGPTPSDYPVAQGFAKALRAHDPDAWGIVYRSVRDPGGECIAALRPPAVSVPTHGPHLTYVWDGRRITTVYEKSDPLFTFD